MKVIFVIYDEINIKFLNNHSDSSRRIGSFTESGFLFHVADVKIQSQDINCFCSCCSYP